MYCLYIGLSSSKFKNIISKFLSFPIFSCYCPLWRFSWCCVDLDAHGSGRGFEGFFFSRKWPENTNCDAFLLFNALSRAHPKGSWCTSSSTPLSSPPGTLGFRGRRWLHRLHGNQPQTMEFLNAYLLCVTIFFSFKWLPHLFPQRWLGLGGALCKQARFRWKQQSVFQSPGLFLSQQQQFLVEIFIQDCERAFSFFQQNKLLPSWPPGPTLPLKHLRLLMDIVNEDVIYLQRLCQALACVWKTWARKVFF